MPKAATEIRASRMNYLWAICALALPFSGLAQGTFQNLDFEAAEIVPIVGSPYFPHSVAPSNAVPAWEVSYGTTPVGEITYNDPAVGSTWVNLWATNGQQIDGGYSVLLQGGLTASAASISQTGLVPSTAKSLLFEARPGGGTLSVSLGGESLLLVEVGTGPNYVLYGADISAFAGQNEPLTFSALEDFSRPNDWNIDDIQFSPTVIPEPNSVSLVALGAVAFGWRRRQHPLSEMSEGHEGLAFTLRIKSQRWRL